MRKTIRLGACIGVCTVLLSLMLSGRAWAEEPVRKPDPTGTVYYDYTDDQFSYGEKIAELNRSGRGQDPTGYGTNTVKEEGSALFALLCRTRGQAVDFSQWKPLYVIAGPNDCYTLYFTDLVKAQAACRELSEREDIRYAELDAEVSACGAEEISFHSWGAYSMAYDEYVDYSRPWQSGSVTVAVIDSGVCLHPLLADRILESGYDYIDADTDATNDLYGHGTNVAGILADCTPEAAVWIYPIRVLNASGGGSASNVANAVREATDKGVQVINLSLESGSLSQAMDDAITDAVGAGITVVVAAGNKASDTANRSPAHLENAGVIVVGAAEADGSRASYSNYGASVDLYAYGSNIECCSRSGGYTSATGTSMAAPHISALASLLQLIHPSLSPADTEARAVLSTPGDAEIRIPDLQRAIPKSLGFSLEHLAVGTADEIPLPVMAFPVTAAEEIRYECSDSAVLAVENGNLVPLGEGTAVVTAACTGLEPCDFTVTVEAEQYGELLLPTQLKEIEDEAFYGDGGYSRVRVPEGVERIGERAFDDCEGLRVITLPASVSLMEGNSFSGAVVLCPADSAAASYAENLGMAYILLSD